MIMTFQIRYLCQAPAKLYNPEHVEIKYALLQNVRYGWVSSPIHSPMVVVCILNEDKSINRQSRQLPAPAKNEGR